MSTKPTISPSPTFIKIDPLASATINGLYTKSLTQYLRLTKLTVKQYLEECIKPDGQFRKFFDNFARFTIGFEINKNLSSDNIDKKHMQIAAYYSDSRERPPQIFIHDSGYDYTPASLGSLTAGWNLQQKDGEQVVRIMDVVPLPIEISCVALSMQDLEDMQAFVTAALGQFQRFTCNYVLRPAVKEKGVYWEVRLPLTHQFGPKSNSPFHGDPRIQFWQSSCNLEVEFENSTYMQYRAAPIASPDTAPIASPENGTLSLTVPDEINLQNDTPIVLEKYAPPISVYSTDPRIAIVRTFGRNRWIIVPRRVGTFTLMVTKTIGDDEGPRVLTSKSITVQAR